MFNAYDIVQNKKYYKIVTHAFFHADTAHLIFNMLTLYFFGKIVEAYFGLIWQNGNIIYIIFYLSAAIASSLPDLKKHKDNPDYNALGASGAISAILFSAIMFYPTMRIYIFFIPIGIPAIIFAPLYLIYCQWMAKKNVDNIGHSAHFWGAIYGILFTVLAYPKVIDHFLNLLGIR